MGNFPFIDVAAGSINDPDYDGKEFDLDDKGLQTYGPAYPDRVVSDATIGEYINVPVAIKTPQETASQVDGVIPNYPAA